MWTDIDYCTAFLLRIEKLQSRHFETAGHSCSLIAILIRAASGKRRPGNPEKDPVCPAHLLRRGVHIARQSVCRMLTKAISCAFAAQLLHPDGRGGSLRAPCRAGAPLIPSNVSRPHPQKLEHLTGRDHDITGEATCPPLFVLYRTSSAAKTIS